MKECWKQGDKQLITYKGLTADFSSETLGNRRQREVTFKVLKEKNPINQEYSIQQNSLFKNEGKIKPFSDKEKLSEYIASRPALQELLSGNPQKVLESDLNPPEETKSITKCN